MVMGFMIMIMMDEEKRRRGEWSLEGNRTGWVGLGWLNCASWGVGSNGLV